MPSLCAYKSLFNISSFYLKNDSDNSYAAFDSAEYPDIRSRTSSLITISAPLLNISEASLNGGHCSTSSSNVFALCMSDEVLDRISGYSAESKAA